MTTSSQLCPVVLWLKLWLFYRHRNIYFLYHIRQGKRQKKGKPEKKKKTLVACKYFEDLHFLTYLLLCKSRIFKIEFHDLPWQMLFSCWGCLTWLFFSFSMGEKPDTKNQLEWPSFFQKSMEKVCQFRWSWIEWILHEVIDKWIVVNEKAIKLKDSSYTAA